MRKFTLENYLLELEELVNIDSGPDNPKGISEVGSRFADAFRKLGWIVECISISPHTGNCIVVKNRNAEHYDVMLVGHTDTVFPSGETAKRPFRRDEKRAYGVGVLDMKQGCLAMYYALAELDAAVLDKLNIVAIFNPDEEIGSPYSTPLLLSYAEKSDYAFVFEAASTDGSRCFERKGRMKYHYEFHGTKGHAGYIFENDSISAVNEMAYWIVELNKLHSPITGTSVNAGVAKGGIAINIVPDYAELQVEIRYDKKSEMEKAKALIEQLKEHAAKNRVGLTEKLTDTRPPLVPDERTKAYIERVRKISESLSIPFKYKKRGGLSDANNIAALGPICADGLGPTGDCDHSEDEYLDIETIEPNIRFAKALLVDLAELKKGRE